MTDEGERKSVVESEVLASAGAGIAALAEEPKQIRFAALEVPTFRWYWTMSWISQTGDGMENVIRNVLVVQLAGAAAPFWLGMMVFAHWVPFTLFSLYGGVLADRYDNRKVQMASQLLLMSAAIGVAWATLAGFVTVWWIFGLLLLHGFAGAIGGPARQTLIHAIVGRERLLSAISLTSSIRTLSQVIGPAIAGFIVVAFGPGVGFLVNAVTFVPLLVLLAIIRVAASPRSRTPIVPALRDGVSFVRGRPLLGALIGSEMLGVIFIGQTFASLLVLFAYDLLHVDALGYSFLLVASGIGAAAAAVYLAYSKRPHTGRFVLAAGVAQMIAVVAFALSSNYLLSFLVLIAFGAAEVLAMSLTNTTLQMSAPDALRGRVMGAYSFGTQGMRVLNGPILGGLAIAFGAPLAVAGSAVAVLVGLVALLARVPQLRERAG